MEEENYEYNQEEWAAVERDNREREQVSREADGD